MTADNNPGQGSINLQQVISNRELLELLADLVPKGSAAALLDKMDQVEVSLEATLQLPSKPSGALTDVPD